MRAEEQPTACIAQGMAAPGAAMKAETSQFRAAVWKKRKRDEKGSGSGEDDEGGGEMIVHVPKAVEKRILKGVRAHGPGARQHFRDQGAGRGGAEDVAPVVERHGVVLAVRGARHRRALPGQAAQGPEADDARPGTKGFVVDKAGKTPKQHKKKKGKK